MQVMKIFNLKLHKAMDTKKVSITKANVPDSYHTLNVNI